MWWGQLYGRSPGRFKPVVGLHSCGRRIITMRASLPLLLTFLFHGCLAGACSGEPMKSGPDRPPAPAAPEGARVLDFEAAAAGASPEGFTFARTGRGEPGRWEVV